MAISTTQPSYLMVVSLFLLAYALGYVYYRLVLWLSRRRMIKKHGCQPPVTASTSRLGSIYSLQLISKIQKAAKDHKLGEYTLQRYRKLGPTHHGKIHHMDMLFTAEAENIKTMLAVNFQHYSYPDIRKTRFIPLLGIGIFTSDGASWKHSREMLRPNFARDQVGETDTFEEHVSNMIKAIPHDGKTTVDLQELFFRLTIDSATEFLFGESTHCLAYNDSDTQMSNDNWTFTEAWNRSQLETANSVRGGPFYVSPKSFKEDCKIVHDYVDKYVQLGLQYRNARKGDEEKADSALKKDRYVFIHELVKQIDDPIQIRSELLNVLLAGRDTTASLLGNLWFTLARRPDVWAKLHKEVDALNGARPTFEQLKEMKYLKAVMNESLRLNPVVPFNSRMATTDTVLPIGGGPDGKSPVFVAKGTMVNYAVYVLHRRTEYWGPDAEEFRPERWETSRPGWEYLPFNGGPRVCIGQQYALTEAGYTTVRLMQEFKGIVPRDGRPWVEGYTLTCCSLNGTKVALIPA